MWFDWLVFIVACVVAYFLGTGVYSSGLNSSKLDNSLSALNLLATVVGIFYVVRTFQAQWREIEAGKKAAQEQQDRLNQQAALFCEQVAISKKTTKIQSLLMLEAKLTPVRESLLQVHRSLEYSLTMARKVITNYIPEMTPESEEINLDLKNFILAVNELRTSTLGITFALGERSIELNNLVSDLYVKLMELRENHQLTSMEAFERETETIVNRINELICSRYFIFLHQEEASIQ